MAIITCEDIKGATHQLDESKFIPNIRVYGVYITSGQILLVKDPQASFWELPGGGVEQNETEFAALEREVIEETGLIIDKKTEPITSFNSYFFNIFKNEGWKSDRKFFFIDVIGGKILFNGNGKDTEQVKFFDISNLYQIVIKPDIKSVISQALELKNLN